VTFDSTSPSTTDKHQDDPLWDLHPPSPLPLLIRATDGKSHTLGKEGAKDRTKNREKVRLSTVVQPDDVEAFFARYAEVCKSGMASLKKRDRRKRAKKGKKGGKGEEGKA
jgi:signal recognition particle subunit SRP14